MASAPLQHPTARFPSWPIFEDDEIAAVTAALASGKVNYWTGTEGREFEKEWAACVGTKFGLALMNGTVTMELALIALGVGPGDEVIITPRTFMATATAVMVRGATPIFADVDRDSGSITGDTIAEKITPRTKAIIPVHLGGWPSDMDGLLAAAGSIPLIEDCAQAHGAQWKGKSVGSFGLINSWSFCQDKIMTLGGEGGAITCDDEALWKAMWAYKDHGKSFDAVYHRKHPPGFRWLHEGLGSNWRMTELQAAIGRRQIPKLKRWVEQRRANAGVLNERLSGLSGLRVPIPGPDAYHAYYRWYGFLEPGSLKSDWTRERVCQEITDAGAWCQVGSCSEIYLEKAFDAQHRPAERLPVARELGETSIALLTHPNMTAEHMHQIADIAVSVLGRALR